jgi:hypothetical protein
MCCGSKRSAWRPGSASAPPPRAAPTPPTSVAAGPIPSTQEVAIGDAAVVPRNDELRLSPPQLDASAAPVRRWRLTS